MDILEKLKEWLEHEVQEYLDQQTVTHGLYTSGIYQGNIQALDRVSKQISLLEFGEREA